MVKCRKLATVHVCASIVHEVMYDGCLGDAWQGMMRNRLGKVCKTHTQ